MQQVLAECDKVSADFNPDSVHDLRVAIRRCRSLADGVMALDPDPQWKAMKKAAKALFQRLGALRDIHVMQEWVEKFEKLPLEGPASTAMRTSDENTDPAKAPPDSRDTPAEALLKILRTRENEQKLEARAALEQFDRKQWRRWSKSLPIRAARIRPGSPLFKHLALERWTEARALHVLALRNRSQTAFHALRIGIKRFRYIVENFLPAEHKAWSDDLKAMQDLLGEIHDFDVLWSTALACNVFPDEHSRQQWHRRILSQRDKRMDGYRAKMIGDNSIWHVWRAALPQGKQVKDLATRRLKLWAKHLDPDFSHSERVANLALQLFDGLRPLSRQPSVDPASVRSSLFAAALLHDVGKSRGDKNHHKKSFKMIQTHGTPLGWNAADFNRAAIVARFHRGVLPTRKHQLLRDLLPDEQKATVELAAILRLANALDAAHDGRIGRIQVQSVQGKLEKTGTHRTAGFRRKPATLGPNEPLVILAEGYVPLGPSAQTIAAERHLLETVLHRPIIVKAMNSSRLKLTRLPSHRAP